MSAAAATSLPPTISPTLLGRLRGAGVESCEQWVALKSGRKLIFGVPTAAVREIDAAVRAVLERRRA